MQEDHGPSGIDARQARTRDLGPRRSATTQDRLAVGGRESGQGGRLQGQHRVREAGVSRETTGVGTRRDR
jgi:hypothetical protein